ncbi:MAG TPA: alpha/beta fold hydrolase [Chloroflexota bacterium]|nr:alpha/beta fold hydrolase [Chloroflexota bacterium]
MPSATINDFRIHYERGGQGPLLVLLHGLGSNARSWQHQLQGLAGDYDVVAWDMRGYGSSSDPVAPYTMGEIADDLAGLLDHLGFEKAHVGGLSMGGVIALELYARRPQRVRSLILVDANAGQAALAEEERQRRLDQRLIGAAEPAGLARQRTPMLLSPDASPEVVAEAESIMEEIHPEGYRFAARAFAETDEREVLPRIVVPTLVVWGEADTVTTREEVDSLVNAIPGAQFEVIPRAGHLCNQENPEAFNGALRRFLAGVP